MNWKGEEEIENAFPTRIPEPSDELRSNSRIPSEHRKKLISPNKKMKTQTKKNCGPWESGNPKPGFPLSHRPESPAAQGKELPFTQNS